MEGGPPPPPPPAPPVFIPEEPVATEALRLLVINPGLGAYKGSSLQKQFVNYNAVTLPEPTDDLEGGVTALTDHIANIKPHVLVAGSRGGKYAAEAIQRGIWKGPTLLISAMSTNRCIKEGIPIVLAHGTNDGTNPILRVKQDIEMGTPGLVQLREFEADHSLAVVCEGDTLKQLVGEAYQLGQKALAEGLGGGGGKKNKGAGQADARQAMLLAIQARKKD